ncbi:hypothetical protein IJJ08_03315 [bacterium]|nr:hypothetical protein [bacterium]
MTKQERNWLVGGSVGTVFLMFTFVFLMSDYSPLHHPATSNTQALIDSLNALQSHPNEGSSGGELTLDNKSASSLPTAQDSVSTMPDAAHQETAATHTQDDENTAASDNNQLKATDIDWETVDTNTIDFDNLDLTGSDVVTGDQVLQLLQNQETNQ